MDNASLLFCCVDTPPTYSGDADLSRVEAVIAELGESEGHAIVMKSTVPVGTGRSITRRFPNVGYVSNPEFLKEGSAIKDFMNPDRVVIGADEESKGFARRVDALYGTLGGDRVRTDVASAEMVKLASNAFLATKISFINEIANVSEELGADVKEVARGMGLDERIGPKFLQAGIGYGGSCFPKDVSALKQLAGNTGYHFQLLDRRHRGQRAPEAADRGQAAEAPGLAGGQADRAAGRGLQAQHRRRARGHQPRALGPAAGRGRPGAGLRPRGRRGRPRDAGRGHDRRPRPRRRSRAPTARCW